MSDNDVYRMILSLAEAKRTWSRKRMSVGKDWKPPEIQDADEGLWCKRCHIRHPYNGRSRLGLDYERRREFIVFLWLCPVSGDVIGERSRE